ncbi:S-adenosyl-L-methionine-dependent methyltransferase [Zopfia rhizophila CBS 207.26]|uniref:S-adenosyl-L-methionine-dependent methyltransferase n=1 Tax=Zopfia rhizophila CBS 207.26 TaxID=1314779 RepID=A0A6A6EN86_9PEZI|nr:S-adenosyl-L-methionine-dependent methyltransferase [Zopfia rhizophila CBS 207.26]
MVHYTTSAAVRNAFDPLVGIYEWATFDQAPDADKLIEHAGLVAGESVLDLGTGSGRVIIRAKRRVGSALCVGLDCVPGFVDTDAPANIQASGFSPSPDAPASVRINLVRGNVTDGALPNLLRQQLGVPSNPTFNVITGLHVHNTIRPDAQVQALQTWKRLLAPGGRMVISFSALINGTECPASVTLIETPVPFQTQLLNTGQSVINRRIVAQKKIAPSAMWDICKQQVRDLAHRAGLKVVGQMHNIGGENVHNLPLSAPRPNEPANLMTHPNIEALLMTSDPTGYDDISLHLSISATRQLNLHTLAPDQRNIYHIDFLQQYSLSLRQSAEARGQLVNWSQVGVIATLRVRAPGTSAS